MLNKLFSKIGIGSAKIDTRLNPGPIMPGGDLAGQIAIRGGNVERDIRGIVLRVVTDYEVESDDNKYRTDYTLAEYRVPESFMLRPGEERTFPIHVRIPYTAPVSLGKQQVWIKTELDIAGGVDSTDKDPIHVVPTPLMGRVLEGMERLGLYLRNANCEKGRGGAGVPFTQEFEFVPRGGYFGGRVDEIDVIFRLDGHSVEVLLEVDRKARGFSSFLEQAFDMDERYVRLRFDNSEAGHGPDYFADRLNQAITPHLH